MHHFAYLLQTKKHSKYYRIEAFCPIKGVTFVDKKKRQYGKEPVKGEFLDECSKCKRVHKLWWEGALPKGSIPTPRAPWKKAKYP
jgi:hypothetical protein